MRWADARLSASIMINSSISVSFTGGQVGWITKTSAPRTFSLTCTSTSPSEKRETSASESGTRRYWAISSASGRLALPLNSFRSKDIGASPWGWLGREDSNLRIRDPKSRALPLGHAPACVSPSTYYPDCGSVQRPYRPAVPGAARQPPADLPRVFERARHTEHRRPAARHQRAKRAGSQQRGANPADRWIRRHRRLL